MSLRSVIRRHLARRLRVPEIPVALERLARLGFRPNLIFDVGAYQGDFVRLSRKIWPESKIIAFEPLEAKANELRAFTERDPSITVYQCLLGAVSRDNVELNMLETGSSVLSEHIDHNYRICRCQMNKLDDIVHASGGGIPDFLKMDVQGYELEVLKGAEQSLAAMQVILAEVNLLDLHVNVPLLADMVGWLETRGWVVYDICGLTRRPLDDALWQADFIFVKKDGQLRSDKRWIK